jgi:predicted ATPase
MLITGLRGVGKTVLLGAFESRARASGWVTVTAEITKN